RRDSRLATGGLRTLGSRTLSAAGSRRSGARANQCLELLAIDQDSTPYRTKRCQLAGTDQPTDRFDGEVLLSGSSRHREKTARKTIGLHASGLSAPGLFTQW